MDAFSLEIAEGTPRVGRGQVVLGATRPPRKPKPEHVANLYRLNDPALAELGLESLLNELLVRIRDILKVDTAAILLLDDAGESLVARAAKGLEEEVERGVRVPVGRGFAGRIALERMPIFIPDVANADVVNPILREKGVVSLLGVPLIVEGNLLGVLHVGTLTPREFSSEDAVALQLAGSRAAPGIERARLFEALEREHRAAVALQRSLLPDRLPELIGVEVAARYVPARDEVGGDWYDVIELPQGEVGIAIGDVVGHGIRAATLMGELRTALRAYAVEGHSPATVLERLDRLLHAIRGQGMATAAYCVFSSETSELRFANAGHPPPLVVTPGGAARFVDVPSAPPLGALPYSDYAELQMVLEQGQSVMLYTDGLIEVPGESLREGLGRLLRAAAKSASAERLCDGVARALVPREGTRDDVALVALENSGLGPMLELRLPARPASLAPVRRALRRWLRDAGASDDDVAALTLACGEACANSVEHAYSPAPALFDVDARRDGDVVTVAVRDRGRWRTPRKGDRGRGMTIIEAAVDEVDVSEGPDGTAVVMRRRLQQRG